MARVGKRKRLPACGAAVVVGGKCLVCGYRPPTRGLKLEQMRHGGLCAECGGPMGCLNPGSGDNGRCRHHGGKLMAGVAGGGRTKPRDPANPNSIPRPLPIDLAFTLPGALGARYAAAINDPTLLSIRTEVALATVREGELAGRLEGEGGVAVWRELKERAASFQDSQRAMARAKQAGDESALKQAMEESQEAIKAILKTIERGNDYESTWSDLMEQARETANLKAMEHSRLKDMRQVMTVEEAMSFAGALITAVSQTVSDRKQCEAIARKFQSLLGENELWRKQRYIAAFGDATGILQEAELSDLPPDQPASLTQGGLVESH